MGGTVQLVVRKSCGEVIALPVWTNSMANNILKNVDFFSGDFTALDNFVTYHNQLQKDYEHNKKSETFMDSNARFFGQHPFGNIRPVDYGIVVVDFIQKQIIDMQDYTSGKTLYFSFKRHIASGEVQMVSLEREQADVKRLNDLINKGHGLQMEQRYAGVKFDISDIRTMDVLLTRASLALKGVDIPMTMDVFGYESFALDVHFERKGFTHSEFNVRMIDEIKQCYEAIKTLDIPMSSDDESHWAKFISNRESIIKENEQYEK